MSNQFNELDDIRIFIDSRRINDAISQLRVIKNNLRYKDSNNSIPVYQERDSKSGFRKVILADGTNSYSSYLSNSKLNQGDVLLGFNNRNILGSPNTLNSKPASR